MENKENRKLFVSKLLKWNRFSNNRPMPWKGEKDPYKIWISEIILQQTRVEQGWGYYIRFVKKYPTVHQLANAPSEDVFKLWEGLGYYSRCKNVIETARFISKNRGGKFPESYPEILALKGVGPYTAAAIGSFAYNLPHAVVDGNVFRVLSRFFGIDKPVDNTVGKKFFTELAEDLLDKKKSSEYNQALMDFGATVCKPQLPLCEACILNKNCVAFKTNKVLLLPVKEKSIKVKQRWFYYLIVEFNGQFLVKKRGSGDIWENLFEFILIEQNSAITETKLKAIIQKIFLKNCSTYQIEYVSIVHKQKLTHQLIQGQFVRIKLNKKTLVEGYQMVKKDALKSLAFPKFISNFLID